MEGWREKEILKVINVKGLGGKVRLVLLQLFLNSLSSDVITPFHTFIWCDYAISHFHEVINVEGGRGKVRLVLLQLSSTSLSSITRCDANNQKFSCSNLTLPHE